MGNYYNLGEFKMDCDDDKKPLKKTDSEKRVGKGTPQNIVSEIEKKVGIFSNYQCEAGQHAQSIPFEKKPAQQLLKSLGCVHHAIDPLSITFEEKPLKGNVKEDIVISAFNKGTLKLTITAERVEELLDSAKIYVNTSLFPKGEYLPLIRNSSITAQDGRQDSHGHYYQNIATQICHVQKIDLLVEHALYEHSQAVAKPKNGKIDKAAPAVLLVSTPALNFDPNNKGVAQHLSERERLKYIKGMYRNIFNAATSEGYKYIAMPAAGLGQFKGKPEEYFNALAEVAKEFPALNIIYHPRFYHRDFGKMLDSHKPHNIIQATKDVFYLADELTKNGYPCAFHNPSDADVVYGVYDVGEYWKNGTGLAYLGEEHCCAVSTGPLNSRLLNPEVYNNPIELDIEKIIQRRKEMSYGSFWLSENAQRTDGIIKEITQASRETCVIS